MRKRMSVVLSILLAFTIVIAGCGSSTNTTPNSPPSSESEATKKPDEKNKDEKITLRMTIWGSSEMTISKNNAVIKKYEELNPNIKIEVENYAGEDRKSVV